jgi:hypothetical protein
MNKEAATSALEAPPPMAAATSRSRSVRAARTLRSGPASLGESGVPEMIEQRTGDRRGDDGVARGDHPDRVDDLGGWALDQNPARTPHGGRSAPVIAVEGGQHDHLRGGSK